MSKNIYILCEYGPEDFGIVGVFTTKELAEEYMLKYPSIWELKIEEFKLNPVA